MEFISRAGKIMHSLLKKNRMDIQMCLYVNILLYAYMYLVWKRQHILL